MLGYDFEYAGKIVAARGGSPLYYLSPLRAHSGLQSASYSSINMQSLFFLFSCFFLILFLHKYAIFVFSSPVCTFFLSIFFLQEYADAIYVISLLFFFVLFCLLCILFLHIIAPQPLYFSLYILFIHECAIGALFSLFCKFLLVLHLIPIEITSVLFSLFVHLCILCILFLHEHGT